MVLFSAGSVGELKVVIGERLKLFLGRLTIQLTAAAGQYVVHGRGISPNTAFVSKLWMGVALLLVLPTG